MKKTRIIHRYKARNLYDTKDRRDIIFKDVVEFIKNGENVRIFEKETKEDITSDVLCRLIFKYSSVSKKQAQLKVLHDIIEHDDSSLQSWFNQMFLEEKLEKITPKFALTTKEKKDKQAKEKTLAAMKANRPLTRNEEIHKAISTNTNQTINLPLGVNNDL